MAGSAIRSRKWSLSDSISSVITQIDIFGESALSSPRNFFWALLRTTAKTHSVSLEKCSEWLQSHEPSSVLYISFGSQNSINPTQMMELAIGLEQSSVSTFVWVIRLPIGFDRKLEFRQEWLPEGFEERMNESKRGLLVRNWVLQLEILSHELVGGFLIHCGWNSVLDSLSQGVPIIGWLLAGEHAFNSKMLVEELGVAVELGEDGGLGEWAIYVVESDRRGSRGGGGGGDNRYCISVIK